jgi:hypothetical protein
VKSYQPGSTVLAIRDGDNRVLNVYGEGVYVGDLPRPGTRWPCAPGDYELIAQVITQNDDVPIEEHPFVAFYDAAVADAGPDNPPKQDRETMIAGLLAEREEPLDDRVRKLYESTQGNPCIYLDSGDIVWGFQCWWGPPEQFEKKFPRIPRVVVPVPEGNGRWK